MYYLTQMRENPLIKEYLCKKVLPIILIGSVGLPLVNYLKNSNVVIDHRDRVTFAQDIGSKITEDTVFSPVAENVIGIDLEGDGKLDAYMGFVGARPGAIDIRPIN